MSRTWTQNELDLLTEAYEKQIDPTTLLPHRTKIACQVRASLLKLKWWKSEDVCRVCNVRLTDDNWYKSFKENRNRICKMCSIRQAKEWKIAHPKHSKRWYEEHRLHLEDRTVTCVKRSKPEKCELCEDKPPTAYHHYGEVVQFEYVPGIWVCLRCHIFAEIYDSGLSEKYNNLVEIFGK